MQVAVMLALRLRAPGPKRILSLDGGGTRGIVTLSFLARMEEALCSEHGTLSDHFDLIGGTSTGAIIASALALGWRVDRIREAYDGFARQVFRRRWYRISPLVNRYHEGALETLLEEQFGRADDGTELLLGSPELRTGLAIVAKRIDTGSPWVVTNIPWAPYHADRGGPNGNWRIPLRRMIRASTAAPTFFRAVSLPIGPKPDGSPEMAEFVDGGASPYNNPALRLLEIARMPRFGLEWPAGRDRMLIVSVGTGRYRTRDERVPFSRTNIRAWARGKLMRLPLMQAINVLQSMIGDGQIHTLRSLQALGHSPRPVPVDSEVGDMSDLFLAREPLFTVLRYDLDLDILRRDGRITEAESLGLRQLDAPGEMDRLKALADEAAEEQVIAADLTGWPQGGIQAGITS
jgi:hypothetical protein